MSNAIDIKAVIGANYGDEGKGLMTDYFASKYKNPLVVCSNGGAQRGHTVVTPDGLRHVFHHFGSGTLCGGETYLPSKFIVNPMIFVEEYQKLKELTGREPKIFISEQCDISTPFDMMLNQILEECRGENKHGSCGVGIWETIVRCRFFDAEPFNLRSVRPRYNFSFKTLITSWVNDSYDEIRLVLKDIKNEYLPRVVKENGFEIPDHWKELINGPKADRIIEHYINDLRFMVNHSIIVNQTKKRIMYQDIDAIIFENAQGLLLDGSVDKIYSTPSSTGANGITTELSNILLDGVNAKDIEICYVTRSYMTRHGNGPLLDEVDRETLSPNIKEETTNIYNPHQGKFRYAPLDFIDMYARCYLDFNKSRLETKYKEIHCIDTSKPKADVRFTIAMTHVDEFTLDPVYNTHIHYMSTGPTRNDVADVGNASYEFISKYVLDSINDPRR